MHITCNRVTTGIQQTTEGSYAADSISSILIRPVRLLFGIRMSVVNGQKQVKTLKDFN